MKSAHRMLAAAAAIAGMLTVSVGALAQGPPTVDGPVMNWKLGAWGKPRAGTANVEKLKQYVEQRTGGKFRIQIGYESFGSPTSTIGNVPGSAFMRWGQV